MVGVPGLRSERAVLRGLGSARGVWQHLGFGDRGDYHLLLGRQSPDREIPAGHGHASGGTIARAEYADGDTGNATQAESDAGC